MVKENEVINLKTIFVKYLRQWKLFLIVFILSFIPAILYLKLYPRTYEFVASILLIEEKESSMSSVGLGSAAGLMKTFGVGSSGGNINVEDEMEILTSNRMMRMMIRDLGLNVTYMKPYSFYKMYHEAPLKLTADSATLADLQDEVRFTVSVSPGKIIIDTKTYLSGWRETFTCSSLPTTIKVDNNAFTLDYDNGGAKMGSFKLKIRCLPASWMAEIIANDFTVEDVSTVSNVLLLNCIDHSKQRGLDMLNSIIKNYNEDLDTYKRNEDLKSMSFIDSRITDVLAELAATEAEIEAYKKKNDMTLLEIDVTLYSEMFKEIQTSIIQANAMALEVDMVEAYIKDPENRYEAIPPILSLDAGEKGSVADYNKALIDRERLLKQSNENNMIYQRADNRVELLRKGVQTMIENARKSAAKTLADLKVKENQLLAKMKSVPEKERDYIALVRNQEIQQGLYLLLLQKKEETIHSLGKKSDRTRVIEPPYIKKKTVGPRRLYAAIGMLVLTLVIPVALLLTKSLILSIKEEYNKNP